MGLYGNYSSFCLKCKPLGNHRFSTNLSLRNHKVENRRFQQVVHSFKKKNVHCQQPRISPSYHLRHPSYIQSLIVVPQSSLRTLSPLVADIAFSAFQKSLLKVVSYDFVVTKKNTYLCAHELQRHYINNRFARGDQGLVCRAHQR